MLSSTKSRLAGKTLLQSLYFFLLVTQICFAQWQLQNPMITQNTLNDVTLIDENTGWAVGDSGIVIKTTDSGLSWFVQESNTEYSLRAVCFVDANNGWAVGNNGTLVNTSSGGIIWSLQNSNTTIALFDICFTSLMIGTAVGENGTILRTLDGGINWTNQSSGTTNNLNSVCFESENIGWTVGDDKTIRKTTNGGTTWIQQTSQVPYGHFFTDVCFVDDNTGWIVGRGHDGTNPHGIIINTSNGGLSWAVQTCPTQAEVSSVQFIDSNNGWASAADNWYGIIKGHILRTTNGGATWVIQYLGVSKETNAIFFTNLNQGIVVGKNGIIQLSTDSGNFWYSPPGGSVNDWSDVFFNNQNKGLVLGDGGTILQTSDRGESWSTVYTSTTNDFVASSFINANEGWSVTGIVHGFHTELRDSSFIFHTTDGGETWIKQLTKPLTLFNDIFFVDQNNGWAIGIATDSIWWTSYHNILLRTNNGGISWSQTSLDTLPSPIKIQFINVSTGWLLCNSPGMGCWGGFFKTSDGGNSWSVSLDYCRNDFQFIDMNNGIVVNGVYAEPGDWGIISTTTDGGQNWSSDSVYSPLYDVFYINQSTVVILGHHYGDQVILYWSTDAGSTWIPRPTGIYEDMKRVFFTDDANGWLVGNNGLIYHTTNGGVSFVEEEEIDEIPTEFLLSHNYPNPFNPSTNIQYAISSRQFVRLKVYDVLGNEIETLVNEEKSAGTYEVTWYAEQLPSGVYFYQLRAGNYIETKKMILMK